MRSLPDYSPILGKTEIDNFHVSTGWGTYGFKAAPIVGVTLAELGSEGETPALIAPSRSSASTRIRSCPSWPRPQSATRFSRHVHRDALILEIAQDATLRPILEVAADVGLLTEEVEPYGRYKAKVDLSVIERLAGGRTRS